MDVSIVIVAWNVRQLLQDCLKSVYEQTAGISFEVVYVDNASEDRSVAMVREQFPEVTIISNSENRGFIVASNQGIAVSSGKYVLLLNSDTIVLDGAIQRTVAFADRHPDAAIVGCKVLNPDQTLQSTCFMYPCVLNFVLSATYLSQLFSGNRFFGRERMAGCAFDKAREVETIAGCFSLVRKEAIDQVGEMDDIYFTYGDDPDWCYRFATAGWKILYTPAAQIIHYGGQTTKRMPNDFWLQKFGSQLIFMRKFRSKLAFRAACLAMGAFFFLRAPFWLLTGLVRPARRTWALQRSKTCFRGAFYCLVDWTRLLMNKSEVDERLRLLDCPGAEEVNAVTKSGL